MPCACRSFGLLNFFAPPNRSRPQLALSAKCDTLLFMTIKIYDFVFLLLGDPGPQDRREGDDQPSAPGFFFPLSVLFSCSPCFACRPLGMDKRGSVGRQDVMGFSSRSPLYVLRCLKWIEFDLSMGKGSPFRLPSTEVD